jgi:hypothetical protein
MPMTDTSPPPLRDPQRERERRRERVERELAAADYLARLHGTEGLHAATLALLIPAGSKRALRAWQAETLDLANAGKALDHVSQLAANARLPWFETLVSRMGDQPLASRQALLESTRRLMAARGSVRPIDRLLWLDMRQRLGGPTPAAVRTAAVDDLTHLPQGEVTAIAKYTAFLSRMVPVDAAEATPPAEGPTRGEAWYDAVMDPWRPHADVEPCHPPDSDGLVQALLELQAMAWMQRPMLVRGWVVAAREHSTHHRFTDAAADALRLTCSLLDSPLAPELARHYGHPPQPVK